MSSSHGSQAGNSRDAVAGGASTLERSFGSKTNESLPDAAIGRISQLDLSHWTAAAMEHYGMPVCFLALEAHCGKGMYLKGRHGLDTSFVQIPSICHHDTARELPIIVADTYDTALYRYDQLVVGPPKTRFYVGAPLLLPGKRCIGTLCIMDSRPRSFFSLRECSYLVDCAKQIAALLHREVDVFLCATVESLASLKGSRLSNSDGDGNSGTCDSLQELDWAEQSSHSAADGQGHRQCEAGTLESLGAIPEEDDDLVGVVTRDDGHLASGGEPSEAEPTHAPKPLVPHPATAALGARVPEASEELQAMPPIAS